MRHSLNVALRSFGRGPPSVLAKVLLFRQGRTTDISKFLTFEKQILLVRDPRDRLISRLLFNVYNSSAVGDDRILTPYLELLRRKEHDPTSVAVTELIEAAPPGPYENHDWFSRYADLAVDQPLGFHGCHPELFVFKYEDMVNQKFGTLGEYLELPLLGSDEVHPGLERVIRTRASGSWRDWFTRSDIQRLAAIFEPYLARYYPAHDWTLNSVPCIPTEHASGYVERLVNEKRAMLGLAPLISHKSE
jgi:hypothetical protein